MSFAAVDWAIKLPASVTPPDRWVLVVIAHHADGNGRAWPGYDTIAAEAGVDRRTAIRSVNRLERARLLAVIRATGRGHSNRYLILTDKEWPADTLAPTLNGGPRTPFTGEKGCLPAQERVSLSAIKGGPQTPEPKENQKRTAQRFFSGRPPTAAALDREADYVPRDAPTGRIQL